MRFSHIIKTITGLKVTRPAARISNRRAGSRGQDPFAQAVAALRRVATGSLAVLLLLLGASCADRDRLGPVPDDNPVQWELGPVAEHPVPGTPGAIVTDAASGTEFRFPEGGDNTLRVAPIVSGPTPPYAGQGISVEYDGDEEVQLLVDAAGAGRVLVFGHGAVRGAINEPAGEPRWVSVPEVDTLGGKIACLLTMPYGSSAAAPGPAPAARGGAAVLSLQATPPGGFNKYWISSIPAGASVIDTMLNIELQASSYLDDLLAALTPARRTPAQREARGRLSAHYTFDGFYYQGFWMRSLGSHGRMVHPTLHYRTSANAGNVAHELGHHFTHILVGDDTWSTLEGQAPVWDTGHGIRDVLGRGIVLEEYAYLVEFHLVGSVKSYDLYDPYVIFSGMRPADTDFPGVEGFGAVMLANLGRSAGAMRDLVTGQFVPAPVVNLSWGEIYEIVAEGATDINTLRARIEARLGGQATKLPALLQRCGWRYAIQGRYVDATGAGVPGVTTTAVSRPGPVVYQGGFSSLESAGDGKFAVTGGVFGGASELRAIKGPDTAYVAIQIDWDQPTSTRQDLGNLVVNFPPVIADLSPGSGAPGTAVTIQGRNFGPAQGGGSVSFNGTAASVSSWSDAAITASVPAGARSGPVTVTRGGLTSNGVDFVVTGVGHWTLLEVEVVDWPATTSIWCNIAELNAGSSSYTLRCGYDNPNFTEPTDLDWETLVTGTWTVPPAELHPGEELSVTITVATSIVRADSPPTHSNQSLGWTYIDAWGTLPPTVTGSGTQTTRHIVPMVGPYPAQERLVFSVYSGGYTGRIGRRYFYRWEP